MTEHLLIGLALIATLGIGAQWLAWRLRVPSILLLLIFGFGVGNLTRFVEPDEMFGDVLFPLVSFAVAIILFEGGLSLRYSEAREVGATVLNLVTAGTAITWTIGSFGAWLVLSLDPTLSVLLGAILVVTGPTVITPLLQHVRPTGKVGSVLKWEGITIDPIAAMLTVLVFEAIASGGLARATTVALAGVFRTIIVGGAIGVAAAAVLTMLLRRFWIPDFLQNPVAFMFVLAAFTASSQIQDESGLFTAPLMGMILANRRALPIRHIVEFQESIRVLLLAGLFIVLGARVSFSELQALGWRSFAYLGMLVLVARPLAVLGSTLGSDLSWRERVFLAAVAPRGVVAAAIASIFAIRLVESGRLVGERLVAETFFIIVGTVAIYGLTARPIARWLGVARRDSKGLLMIGAYNWTRQIAKALQDVGQRVVVVDTNRTNVQAARMAGLEAVHADARAPQALDKIDLGGIGRLLAMTSNEEFNTLAAIHFAEAFGRSEVFQLQPDTPFERGDDKAGERHGRWLFGEGVTFTQLTVRFAHGAQVRTTPLTDRFDYDDFKRTYGRSATPIFLINGEGDLVVFTTDSRPNPAPGQTLISIVEPEYALRRDAERRDRTRWRRVKAS